MKASALHRDLTNFTQPSAVRALNATFSLDSTYHISFTGFPIAFSTPYNTSSPMLTTVATDFLSMEQVNHLHLYFKEDI
jgi:hypothetical protein